jgi:glycerol transport system ATP-binding protein
VWDAPDDSAYRAEVEFVEDLGTYKIVSLRLGEHLIKARLQEDQKVPKEHAFISFPEQWLMLYIDEFLVAKDDHNEEN